MGSSGKVPRIRPLARPVLFLARSLCGRNAELAEERTLFKSIVVVHSLERLHLMHIRLQTSSSQMEDNGDT